MAKGIRGNLHRSSALHLVQEDGGPAALNPDQKVCEINQLRKQLPLGKSRTAVRRLKSTSLPETSRECAKSGALNPVGVLRELFELLEDYAPAWYTEENHHRAVAALAQSPR